VQDRENFSVSPDTNIPEGSPMNTRGGTGLTELRISPTRRCSARHPWSSSPAIPSLDTAMHTKSLPPQYISNFSYLEATFAGICYLRTVSAILFANEKIFIIVFNAMKFAWRQEYWQETLNKYLYLVPQICNIL
jgi:hypothetical protein